MLVKVHSNIITILPKVYTTTPYIDLKTCKFVADVVVVNAKDGEQIPIFVSIPFDHADYLADFMKLKLQEASAQNITNADKQKTKIFNFKPYIKLARSGVLPYSLVGVIRGSEISFIDDLASNSGEYVLMQIDMALKHEESKKKSKEEISDENKDVRRDEKLTEDTKQPIIDNMVVISVSEESENGLYPLKVKSLFDKEITDDQKSLIDANRSTIVSHFERRIEKADLLGRLIFVTNH